MARFEYMICSAQLMRITFVNGKWQGELPPDAAGALDSCPNLLEFLEEAGESGWELVSVTSDKAAGQDIFLATLYLKREKIS